MSQAWPVFYEVYLDTSLWWNQDSLPYELQVKFQEKDNGFFYQYSGIEASKEKPQFGSSKWKKEFAFDEKGFNYTLDVLRPFDKKTDYDNWQWFQDLQKRFNNEIKNAYEQVGNRYKNNPTEYANFLEAMKTLILSNSESTAWGQIFVSMIMFQNDIREQNIREIHINYYHGDLDRESKNAKLAELVNMVKRSYEQLFRNSMDNLIQWTEEHTNAAIQYEEASKNTNSLGTILSINGGKKSKRSRKSLRKSQKRIIRFKSTNRQRYRRV